ncbi:MAG: hypothetical protein ACM3H8_14270 [Sphingobacteriales bacterium]
MKRISNVFGTTLLVKVFPTVFVGAILLFVAVAFRNVDFWAVLFFSVFLFIFLYSNPLRYLHLKEVFLDYEAQKISISMGKAKWKDYQFKELEDISSGNLDTILKLSFENGDTVSFLAGSLWGKQTKVEKIKKELEKIIKEYSKKNTGSTSSAVQSYSL